MRIALALLAATSLAAPALAQQDAFEVTGSAGTSLTATPTDTFDEPWAMTVLPDGRMLVNEKGGTMVLVSSDGTRLGTIEGTPDVQPAGQGGFGDIVLAPDFAETGMVYVSYVEREDGNEALSGAVVERGTLTLTETGGQL